MGSNRGMDAITTRALLDQGLSRHEISARVSAGTLRRLKRGHYLTSELKTEDHHLALARTMPGAILALETAALVHDLPVEGVPDLVQTVVEGRGRSWRRQRREVRTIRLAEEDVASRDGLLHTSIPRTIVDIVRWRGLDAGLVTWEAAAWRARTSGVLDELEASVDAVIDRLEGHRGIGLARRARDLASPWSQSPQETRSRLIMQRERLPMPVQQFEVRNAEGQLLGVSDFAWPERGLLGEYDGLDKYEYLARPGESPLDVMRREKRRQESMEAEGYRFVRWGSEEVQRPVRLVARLRQADLSPLLDATAGPKDP